MLTRASLFFAAVVATACASTHVTAFRDPAFSNKQFSKLAVFVLGTRLDATAQIERETCKKLAPTACALGLDILPPTRPYSTDDMDRLLARAGVDGVLVLSLASDEARTAYAGTITQATATASSTTTGTANYFGAFGSLSTSTTESASAEATSTPVYSHRREATGYIGVFDRASGAPVWRGEIRISGRGVLAVRDDEFIRSATSKVAQEVRAAGLVSTPRE